MAAPPAEYSFEWRGPAPPPPAKSAADFSPPLIAMVAVIGTAFLIVLYARILSRRLRQFRRRWRRWRRRRRLLRSTTAVSSGAGSFASSSSPEHFFSPYGLDDSAINTLPLSSFSKSTASRDCAVCLLEFDGGDSLRSLPICSHSFHVDCIDVWLRSHATCPLCRAVVFPFSSSPFVPMRAARIRPSIDDLLLLDPPPIESEIAPAVDPAAESNARRDFLLKRSYSFGFERNLAAEASPWRCRNRSLWSKRWPSPFGGGGSSSAPRSTRFLSFRSYVKSPFQRRRGFFFPLSGEPGVRLGGIGPSSRRSRSMTSPSAIFFASSRMRCGDPEALLSPERLNRR